jgi:hypothetical protein
MEKPKKNKLNKNDFISTKKMKKIIKKNKKKIISASFTFLSPLRGEADQYLFVLIDVQGS